MKLQHRNAEQEQRREFLTTVLAGAGIALCGGTLSALLQSCESDVVRQTTNGNPVTAEIVVADYPNLIQFGASLVENVKTTDGKAFNGGSPLVVIKASESQYRAFTAVCTHSSCIVEAPDDPTNDIVCYCHNSHFDAVTGSVKSGPANAPLRQFATSFDSGLQVITVSG